MTNLLRRSVMLISLAVLALPSVAQADADDDADQAGSCSPKGGGRTQVVTVEDTAEYVPQANTIATRLPVSLVDTPTNVGTVNEALIKDQYDLFVGSALRNVSSVNAQSESGVADYFLIRGFDSLSSAMVLTDGAAEPEVSFFQTYNVERVEVLKGPGGFLYSRTPYSGAVGGAVNIVRHQPVPASFTGLSLSGGSFGTYQGTVDWNIANDPGTFGFRLNSMYRESDFWRDDKNNRTWGINPAFTWWLGEDSAVNLNVEYLDLEYQPDSGIPIDFMGTGEIADVDRSTSYQSVLDFSDQNLARVQVDYQTKLSETWDLRNKTYYRRMDWKSNGTLVNGLFDNPFTLSTEVLRSFTLLDDLQESVGNQIEGVFQKTAGESEHNLLLGVELAVYRDTFTLDLGCDPATLALPPPFNQCVLPSVDPDDPMDPVQSHSDLTILPFQSGDATTRVASPYAIYQVKANSWFQAQVGARFDALDFQDDVTGESFDDSTVSPMLGLVFNPAKNMSIYASASESFAPPSVRTVDFLPEEGRQFEIGFKSAQRNGKIQTTVAAYQLERTNIPIRDDNGFTQQAGDQRSRGLELDVSAEVSPGLNLFFSYAYTDAVLTEFTQCPLGAQGPSGQCLVPADDWSGNTPAFVPENLANFWLSHRFSSGFGYGGGLRYVGEQFISENNVTTLDPYTLVDAALYYGFGRWEFQLNFKNITDVEYETRGFSSMSVVPAAGRSVFGGVEVRF